MRFSTVKVVLGVLSALIAIQAAHAQSNSLSERRMLPRAASVVAPPTSQPAARPQPAGTTPAMPLYNAASVSPPPRIAGLAPRTSYNSVLMSHSLIAVPPAEPAKIGVDDQITVIIREDKTATSNQKLDAEKDWNLDSELEKWFRLDPSHNLIAQNFADKPGAKFKFKNDYSGKASADRKDSLVTRIQAKVIDVKPNGVLVVEARKEVVIDEEGYIIKLIGECRSQDVTPTNTVLSTQLAGAKIDVQHSGALRDATKRGWLTKILDFVKPL